MLIDILKENKNKILIAGANILCLCALIYIFALMIQSEHIETERAELEVRRDIINFTAYLFRNEEVIYAGASGIETVYLVENGEKVAKSQAVARINQNMRDGSADLVRAEIENLEKKIDILKKSNINLEYAAANIAQVNKDSNDLYTETLKNIEYNRIREAGRNRGEMLILLNKRQLITGDAENYNEIINLYTERKRELENSAVSAAFDYGTVIETGRSGVFYRKPDGHEDYFTGEAVKTLDLEKFEELIRRERSDDIINRAVGKVAYDYNWFFVCRTDERELGDVSFKEGEVYDIICPYSSNRVVPFALRSRIRHSDGLLLIFETAICPDDFNFLRRQTVQIVSQEVRGIKVPDNAIVVRQITRTWEEDENGEKQEIIQIIENPEMPDGEVNMGETVKGVYILSGSEVIFRRLDDRDIIAQFDGYVLYKEQRAEGSTTTLQAFEDIITAGKNLYNGKIIS